LNGTRRPSQTVFEPALLFFPHTSSPLFAWLRSRPGAQRPTAALIALSGAQSLSGLKLQPIWAMKGVPDRPSMLHTTKLLAVGAIHAVSDDPEACNDLSCGDRDAAFALVAESDDDVFAFLSPDDSALAAELESGYSATPSRDWSEDGDEEPARAADPVRFYFFCRNEEDRHWLHSACFARRTGIGLAALEICPATGAGTCLLRVPRGVRTIPILTAE